MRVAYGLEALTEQGFTGKGQTVVDIVSFGSPTLQQDMDVFDRQFALPPMQEIVSALGKSAPVIYYTKASNHLLLAAADSGADVLSVDWRVDLRELRRTLGPRVALQGNVDPGVLFAPPDTIRKVTQDTLAALTGAGHILNLGHGILPDTPVENAKIFVETGQSAAFAPDTASAVQSR